MSLSGRRCGRSKLRNSVFIMAQAQADHLLGKRRVSIGQISSRLRIHIAPQKLTQPKGGFIILGWQDSGVPQIRKLSVRTYGETQALLPGSKGRDGPIPNRKLFVRFRQREKELVFSQHKERPFDLLPYEIEEVTLGAERINVVREI
jgi:hypothetical protein